LAVVLGAAIADDGAPADATPPEDLLRYSLQVEIDPIARDQIAAARDELDRGDAHAAMERWSEVLATSQGRGLIPDGDLFRTPSGKIRKELRVQTDEVHETWIRFSEPAATAALSAALLSDDVSAFWRIADQFPETPTERRALLEIAVRSFDAGDALSTISACERLLQQPDHSAIPNQLPLWLAISLTRAGRPLEAARIWKQHQALVSPITLEQARRDREIALWIRQWNEEVPVNGDESGQPPNLSDFVGERWDRRTVESVEAFSLPNEILRDFEVVSHPLLALSSPQFLGDRWIVSSPAAITALSTTGEVLWTNPGGQSISFLSAAELGRVCVGESIGGRFAISGNRIYGLSESMVRSRNAAAVDEAAGQLPGVISPPQLKARRVIVAMDLMTGEDVWRADAALWVNDDAEPEFTLSLPVEQGGLLYYVTQVGDSLFVAARDALSGETRWRVLLGTEGLERDLDPRRKWMPAVILPRGHDLFVATGNGALARIDARSHQVKWINRVSREDWRDAGPPKAPISPGSPRYKLWSGWREPILVEREGKLLWVSPEHDALLAIDRTTGDRLWLQPRGKGLAVIPRQANLLVLESRAARLLNHDTGLDAWRVALPRIAGKGFEYQGWYTLPLRDGRAASIRLRDGAVLIADSVGGDESPPVTEFLSQLRTLSDANGRILMQDAAGRLSVPTFGPFQKRSSVDFDASETPIGQLQAAPTIENAVTFLATANFDLDSEIEFDDDDQASRRVRGDVFAVSLLIDADPEPGVLLPISSSVGALLDQQLLKLDATDAAAGDRFVERLAGTTWGAAQWLDRLLPRVSRIQLLDLEETTAIRLKLESLSAAEGAVGATARRLVETVRIRPPSRPEAWPLVQPTVSMREAHIPAAYHPIERRIIGNESLADLQVENHIGEAEVRFSGGGEDRPWGLPLPETNRNLGHDADFQRAWFVGPLAVIQNGTRVLGVLPYNARGERETHLLWPTEDKTPIDTWDSVSTMNVEFMPRMSDLSPGPSRNDDDEFGRPLAQVGPVRTDYFCLRQFSRLVAFETSTGRRRWVREDLPREATAYGDNGCIIVVDDGSRRASLLRPLDGREISNWPMDFRTEQIVGVVGKIAFVFQSGATDSPGVFRAIDLATGTAAWRAETTSDARPFLVGSRFAGVVEPSQIRLFDQSSGSEKTIPVETPAAMENAAAIIDEHALIVLASGPPDISQTTLPLGAAGGTRRPWANGRLFGLDPHTLELRWTLELDGTVFPLDQPPDVPIFVINDTVPVPGANDPSQVEGRLRCFEKRTGELLFRSGPAEIGAGAKFVVERGEPGSWVEVRTSKRVIRFDYRQ
jgi:outer membrane protein assembly factor BamB